MLCIRQNRPAREREQRETASRPTFLSTLFLLPLISGRCSPRGERMIGWRCNSWYAFLPRPTSRQCLFVYSVYTTPGYRWVITVVHHGQLDETACRMPAANCCSRVCWTLMQLWRILILWISDSAFSVSAFGKSVARIRVAKIWDGRKYLYNSKNCRKKK